MRGARCGQLTMRDVQNPIGSNADWFGLIEHGYVSKCRPQAPLAYSRKVVLEKASMLCRSL
jgi:hypothetical protein